MFMIKLPNNGNQVKLKKLLLNLLNKSKLMSNLMDILKNSIEILTGQIPKKSIIVVYKLKIESVMKILKILKYHK